MAHHRLAADERDMQRLVLAHEIEHASNKSVAAEIAESLERDAAAQVRVSIGVTSRAAERALPRDLDRKHGDVAGENSAPSGEDLPRA